MKKLVIFLFCFVLLSSSALAEDNTQKNKVGDIAGKVILSPFYLIEGVFNSIDNIMNGRPGKIWEDPRIKEDKARKAAAKATYENYFYKLDKKLIDAYANKNIKFASVDENTKVFTIYDANPDKTIVLKKYKAYLSNKNNMKYNRELYDRIQSYIVQFKEIIPEIDKEYKEAYNKAYYTDINYEQFKENCKNTILGFSFMDTLDKDCEELKEIAQNIYDYSYNYEKQKYVTWAQKNHKKMIANISLSSYVYQPYAPAPQSGYLYVYNPKMDFTLQAFQTVPGGVILTGSYYMVHTPEIDNIFLQTSKKYADGKYILEPIIAEYKGYYDYYTVLGVKKRIYKFYRLGESEIKKNFEIPGQPFYFYLPY